MCSTGGRLRDHATALFGGKIRIVVATLASKTGNWLLVHDFRKTAQNVTLIKGPILIFSVS